MARHSSRQKRRDCAGKTSIRRSAESCHGAHPTGELGHQRLGGLLPDGAGEFLPRELPAADVARLEALQPAAEAHTDETLGGGEHGSRGTAKSRGERPFWKVSISEHQLLGP
ncbi:MAG: hypothetical protein WDN31_14235 [Hyphomicrobium sp.]